jgi:hypothetical protein
MIRTYIVYSDVVYNLQFRPTGNYLVQARKNRIVSSATCSAKLFPDVSSNPTFNPADLSK